MVGHDVLGDCHCICDIYNCVPDATWDEDGLTGALDELLDVKFFF